MSNYSEFMKECAHKDKVFFYGDSFKRKTNKYFTFDRIIDDENIIIVTSNIKTIKDNYVLVTANNQVVYLKDWQVRKVHNFDLDINAYVVKLNKKYFKPYTFNFVFEDYADDFNDNWETLVKCAESQQVENLKWAEGWMC